MLADHLLEMFEFLMQHRVNTQRVVGKSNKRGLVCLAMSYVIPIYI